jgi:ABC-type nitrate/sulfonate/bicarbonate transport system substrate-binding protein
MSIKVHLNRIASFHILLLASALTHVIGPYAVSQEFYTFSITDRLAFVPALVAQDLGFWKEQGIDIRVFIRADDEDLFDITRQMFKQTHYKHGVDFLACRGGDLAFQQATGLEIVPIAAIADDLTDTVLIAQKKLDNLSSLEGKRIACDLATANVQFLAEALKQANLQLEDVTIVDLQGMPNPRRFLKGGVDAIVLSDATSTDACTRAGGKTIASAGEFRKALPGYVLAVKKWLGEKEPKVTEKFIAGYDKAQQWVLNPANAKSLAAIVDKHFYFVKWQAEAPPLGIPFVTKQLARFKLRSNLAMDDDFGRRMKASVAFFEERAQKMHDGFVGAGDPPSSLMATPFNNTWAWWRFAGPYDYRNYGSGGRALDLNVGGNVAAKRDAYGITQYDYFRRDPIWTHGGFENDAYGWAVDGIGKFLTTRDSRPIEFPKSFTIWVRSTHRNTCSTRLVGQGKPSDPTGFSLIYEKGDSPEIVFVTHPASRTPALRLTSLPKRALVDVCIAYNADADLLRGWAFNSKTGETVSTAEAKLKLEAIQPSTAPLTIGGFVDQTNNLPLHGNIEAMAIWDRALGEDQVKSLTVGPPKKHNTSARSWINVKTFGAVGDGAHDDTDAIQAAIDSATFELTTIDPQSGRPWFYQKQGPANAGRSFGGVIHFPLGSYRTTRPIVLHQNSTLIGDEGQRPIIASEAEAAVVWWNGPWHDRAIDFKVRGTPNSSQHRCTDVTLKNLVFRGRRFGGHTMGVDATRMRLENCQWEGAEAGFVATGSAMFSTIRDCQFDPAIWLLPKIGARFNTSLVENIVVGLSGMQSNDWAMRLEGCIQCVTLTNIAFETRGKCIYLDAFNAGHTIDLRNIWDYDVRVPNPEVLRILAGRAINISNVMGADFPSTVFIGKKVRSIEMHNVMARSITVEDPEYTKPIFVNVPAPRLNASGELIDENGAIEKRTAAKAK